MLEIWLKTASRLLNTLLYMKRFDPGCHCLLQPILQCHATLYLWTVDQIVRIAHFEQPSNSWCQVLMLMGRYRVLERPDGAIPPVPA